MYRVYHGILQPARRAALSRQISVINVDSLFPRQENHELSAINAQLNRKRTSAASLISVNSDNSCSSCETDVSDVPKHNIHKRVTFSLNPSLTIHEHVDNENEVNAEVINEWK